MDKMDEGIFVTKSSGQTRQLGREFVKNLAPGDTVCLYGELGSGKTTFVQGMARGLGITTRLISPTFVLMRRHKMKVKGKTRFGGVFSHIDLYRLESGKEIQGLGLEEILNDKGSIVVVEWAEKLGELLPNKRWDVRFDYINDSSRRIMVKKRGG